MSRAVATVSFADVPGFPVGTVVDHVSVVVTDQAGAVTKQDIGAADASATFENLADGAYTASAQAFDAAGNGLAAAVTTAFVLSSPETVTLSVPSSVTFAQA